MVEIEAFVPDMIVFIDETGYDRRNLEAFRIWFKRHHSCHPATTCVWPVNFSNWGYEHKGDRRCILS